MKNLLQKSYGLMAVFVMAMILNVAGATPLASTGIAFGLSVLAPSAGVGSVYVGLNKEIWLAELMEGFYGDDLFLTECRDLSAFVENDILNLAEAGVNPDVLVNNTTYPIATAERADGLIQLEIDRFDTENQHVKNADLVELAYDKLTSIIYGHKQSLRMKIMEKAAHAIAPASNTTFTPLLTTTGADDGFGNKALTFKDVLNFSVAFDEAEMPGEGRILILSARHRNDLMKENITLYNQLMLSKELYGFKLYSLASKRLPRYNKTTGVKVAFGAASLPTDSTATIAFHKDEVGRAMGSENMYSSEAKNDPIYRRTIIGFDKRAMVLPIRNKGVAAIYSVAV